MPRLNEQQTVDAFAKAQADIDEGDDWLLAYLVFDLRDRVAALEAERDAAQADCKAMAGALDNAAPMKRVHVSCGTASCDVVFLGVLETPELLAVVRRWRP